MNDLIVFSHLRWEFVWQRPQHIISRLAKNRGVLFVEEPINEETKTIRHGNVTVLQPKVGTNLKFDDCVEPIVWFYSPMFIDYLKKVKKPSLIVFDSMDQLAAFKGAPKDLIEKEKKLFLNADIVFTGGKSLYEEKKKYHDNVFCFPSSVDLKHFQKALDPEIPKPEDMKHLIGPVAGYYGVIDERIDLSLLSDAAKRMPDVNFVMIGPVVKINEIDLPKSKNIYYLGGKKYEELPNYLKFFDVCLMPFALNESTKFISPTKTLEYMAADKPIVSTPIYDVLRDYSEVVNISKSPSDFTKAMKNFLSENQRVKEQRLRKQHAVLEKTSWDKTVGEMEKIMDREIAKKSFNKAKKIDVNYLTLNHED